MSSVLLLHHLEHHVHRLKLYHDLIHQLQLRDDDGHLPRHHHVESVLLVRVLLLVLLVAPLVLLVHFLLHT
jgi:hypothetical protein